jgi:hypothetical protein
MAPLRFVFNGQVPGGRCKGNCGKMKEVGPFLIWRAIFALAVTVFVCIATYLIIRYFAI